MPFYDFSSGFGLLNQGIGSLGASLKTANQQTQSVALAQALANGDWNGAMQAAAEAGDTNTVLKLRELKQSGDQAAAFNTQLPEIINKLYPGAGAGAGTGAGTGTGTGTGAATSGAPGYPPGYDPAVVEGKIRAKAQQLGVDPDVAARVYGSEGKSGYSSDKDLAGNYTSFGPLQFHYKTGGGGMGNVSGMGDQFTAATGKNARDPSTIDDQIDFGLRQAKQHGWGQWYGAAKVGISPWQGINATGARSEAAAPIAVAGGNRPAPDAGPNAATAAADVPTPNAVSVSGTAPGSLANSLNASVAPPLPPARPADLGLTTDPAVAQFLVSHVGPQNAAKLLQAPPETPVSTLVQPGDVPPDDMAKTAGQLVSEAKQALAGGMAHGTSAGLGSTLDAPRIAAPMDATGGAPQTPGPPAAMAATGGAPPPVPATPRPTPIYPYGSATPAVGLPPPTPVQAGVPASAPSAPSAVPPPSAPVPAAAPADIAAIERSMPAVQQQAASVGGGQVSDAGMAAASALTSGRPVPQGLGASLQAPVMQALSQGGAPAALTQGPLPAAPPPSAAALPPSVAVDASGSTPPAEAPGTAAATPPPAAAPAIEVPGYSGKFTRAQAEAAKEGDNSTPGTDEWDDAAKAAGVSAAPVPPIDAKLPPTPAAVKAGDPTVTAAAPVSPQVARSLAQTRPGSDQRMMLFALLMRAAANSGPQSAGNVKFVEGLMAIEKQHQEDFGKTLRTVPDAELASIGYTKAPGSVVQADPWGNLKVTPPGAEPAGHVMSDPEVKALGLDPATGTGRVWWQPGKPGAKPEALDANKDSKVVPITEAQKKLYPGAVGIYTGGTDDGKPFYPPGPLVRMEAQGEFEKVYEHAKGDIVAADMQAGNTSNRRIQALSILKDASDAGGNDISSGPFGETALRIKQALAEFGVDIPNGMAPAEVAKKVGFDFATQMVKAISNRPAQMEFVKALSNVPGLEMSRPGRDAMISILTQEAANDQKLAILAQDPENAKKWATVKRDFYNDPANAIMSPFRHGPNGEPVPISKADVFIMAERAGMKPPPEPKPIPPGFKTGKFGPTITDISQMKGTFDRGTPVTLPDGTPGWTQ